MDIPSLQTIKLATFNVHLAELQYYTIDLHWVLKEIT